jgi:hypothetical protein
MVKVHYIGYPGNYDEWRRCSELADGGIGRVLTPFEPSNVSLEDRVALFCDRIKRKIKHTLFATKRESPEVRIEQEIEKDVFEHYFKHVGVIKYHRGREIHCVNSLIDPELNQLFGDKWSEHLAINKRNNSVLDS